MIDVQINGTDESISVYGEERDGRYRLVAGFPGGEQEELSSAPVPLAPGGASVFVWTSDWHIGRGTSNPARIASVVDHVLALNPAGVIDLGDCKDGYGAASASQLDQYITDVRYRLPWAVAHDGAPLPILPGNHDEISDYAYPVGMPTDWSLWTPRMWSPPFRWAADWAGPRVRFLAVHAEIRHANPLLGFFSLTQTELDWLSGQLAGLPPGWKAVVCSHPAANPAFGNEIRTEIGGGALRALLAANQGKVLAYLNGHRHANMGVNVLDGIVHFNGPSVSYTLGNGYGGFATLTHDGDEVVVRAFYGRAPFDEFPTSVYTPVRLQL